ncbi:hypothetical protein N7493_005807 [Penicillium malachiteum]|uniref:Amino acid permease/ SLC12A domain-containing protein n=1 Tax=Penicillium malachiteum TaxID=1324776 RepID=A0AAD6MVS3_9EURO|nr:hypothetical protein N7493_005807 [Penicillium malachiteum]
MAVSGLYLSYLIVLSLLLYRRVQGQICRSSDSSDEIVNVPGAKLVWGPFHCPGIWGTLVNALAVCYCLIVVFFSFWPRQMHPGVTEMNWSALSIGCSILLTIKYYFARARRIYQGPIQECAER